MIHLKFRAALCVDLEVSKFNLLCPTGSVIMFLPRPICIVHTYGLVDSSNEKHALIGLIQKEKQNRFGYFKTVKLALKFHKHVPKIFFFPLPELLNVLFCRKSVLENHFFLAVYGVVC